MAEDGAVALYNRLADALGGHDAHPVDANAVRQAYLQAGMDTATWEDLPKDIQDKVIEIEGLPAQSWDDPSEVPDNLDEL
jgi:hypothetical protein